MKRKKLLCALAACLLALIPFNAFAAGEDGEYDMAYYGQFAGQNASINVFNWASTSRTAATGRWT